MGTELNNKLTSDHTDRQLLKVKYHHRHENQDSMRLRREGESREGSSAVAALLTACTIQVRDKYKDRRSVPKKEKRVDVYS